MQTGLYVAISSQMALEKRLNTLADNIANANTVGFRGTEVKFNQMLGDTKPTKVAYVSKGEEFLNTNNGSLTRTGAALDFAVKGDAWFQIETPAGPALTRDGRFTLTDAGELVTIRGYPVLDAGVRRSSSTAMAVKSPSGPMARSTRTVSLSPRSASIRPISATASCASTTAPCSLRCSRRQWSTVSTSA